MSASDQAAQQYLVGKGLAVDVAGLPAAADPPAATGGGGTPDFIKMPLDIVTQIAKGYSQYGWALKLARVKIPHEIDQALKAIAAGNMEGATELQKMAGQIPTQQQPQQVGEQPPELPEPEVGDTVVTRRMAEKAYDLHEQGWGTRKIAEYFTAKGSPVSHATIAKVINEYEADEGERQLSRRSGILRTLGLYGSFGAITVLIVIVMHLLHAI